MMIHFASPKLLWLLVILLPMTALYVYRTLRGGAAIRISTLGALSRPRRTVKYYLRHLPFVLRCAAVALIIMALARPQYVEHDSRTTSEGIDIVLAIDVSGSMLARDFRPDRITAAKEVAGNFIVDRRGDRIGLVVFSGESFTQSPLTTDQAVLVNVMKDIHSGMIEDGTAIGLGLANAVNRLKDSKAKSKVVILLTDGVNNRGAIAPITAAELAKTFGIRVYTIGVGTLGEAPYPVQTPFGMQLQRMPVEIDEDILTQIADMTGGKYFRATDNKKLEQIYQEIDQLEKSKVEVKHFSRKNEQYFYFALIGALLLIVEALGRYTLLRKIP